MPPPEKDEFYLTQWDEVQDLLQKAFDELVAHIEQHGGNDVYFDILCMMQTHILWIQNAIAQDDAFLDDSDFEKQASEKVRLLLSDRKIGDGSASFDFERMSDQLHDDLLEYADQWFNMERFKDMFLLMEQFQLQLKDEDPSSDLDDYKDEALDNLAGCF